MNKKIAEMVAERVIKQMEAGVAPWKKPWVGGFDMAVSHSTGKRYSLLNQILLGAGGEYITFKQCTEAGGKVRKGEKSKTVVFWNRIKVTEEKDGEKVEKIIPMLKYYNVFEIGQCEGIDYKYYKKVEAFKHDDDCKEAEEVIENYTGREGIKIHRDGVSSSAYYSPMFDEITVPNKEQFENINKYYSTTYHEMVHSTGHEKRLNRQIKNRFGDEKYGLEELVAELGAAVMCNKMGIETEDTFEASSAYLKSWIEAIRKDPSIIISAAGKAEKAVNFIFGEEAVEA